MNTFKGLMTYLYKPVLFIIIFKERMIIFQKSMCFL